MRAEGNPLKLIHTETQLYSSSNSYLTFFTNPIYKGELHYSDLVIPNYCKAIVPAEIWDKVQVIIADLAQKQKSRTSKRHPRRQSGVYLLSGISKCGICNAPHYGLTSYQRNGSAYLRYACTRAKRRQDCSAKPMPANFLEEIVLSKVHQFFDDPQNLINMLTIFQADNSNYQTHLDEELASLTAQIGPIRKAITNLTNAISESGHSSALLKKLAASETLENELLSKLTHLKTQTIPPITIPTTKQARTMAHKIKTDLQSKDRAFVHQILLGIIHEITTTREKDQIHGTITFFHMPSDKKKAHLKLCLCPLSPWGHLFIDKHS